MLSELTGWDRRVDERSSVTLFHLFEDAIWRRTFADEMGEPLFSRFYEWARAERPAGLYAILDEAGSAWFDDIATIDRQETRDDILVLAAEDAATRAATDFASRRAWSEAHLAHFEHPLSGAFAGVVLQSRTGVGGWRLTRSIARAIIGCGRLPSGRFRRGGSCSMSASGTSLVWCFRPGNRVIH